MYISSRFRCIRFFARLPLAGYACPRALDLYPRIVSLPLYPAMTRGAHPLCGPMRPGNCGVFKTGEIRSSRASYRPAQTLRPQERDVYEKPP